MITRHAEFYARLAALLDEFDVDFVATDDGAPYGAQCALINVQFNESYRSDEIPTLSGDGAREMAEQIENEQLTGEILREAGCNPSSGGWMQPE